MPQHPLFCVFPSQVDEANDSFTMTQHTVQAFNLENPVYAATEWSRARNKICEGHTITKNRGSNNEYDGEALKISHYITPAL